MVSPDGLRMAYCSARTGDRELWVRDLETEDEVQATNQAAIDLVSSWSSDGFLLLPGERDRRPVDDGADGLSISFHGPSRARRSRVSVRSPVSSPQISKAPASVATTA